MVVKLKECFNCKKLKLIYKNKEGKKYCKQCFFSLFGWTKIKPVSKKQQTRLQKYMILRNQYLLEHPICEVCNSAASTEIHHKSKRVGDNLFKDFLATCRTCHVYIEEHPAIAKSKGWSL